MVIDLNEERAKRDQTPDLPPVVQEAIEIVNDLAHLLAPHGARTIAVLRADGSCMMMIDVVEADPEDAA